MRVFAVACGVVFVAAGAARGAVSFQFVSDHGNYNVEPGTTTAVNVYLQETLGSAGDTSILVSQNGIFGFDVNLNVKSGGGAIFAATANQAMFSSSLGATYNPATIPSTGAASVDATVSSFDNPGPEGTVSGNTRRLLFATYSVGGGSTNGSMTTFSMQDSTFFGSNTVTNSNTVLDRLIAAQTFTVTVMDLLGDANLDGSVDLTDLNIVLNNLGTTSSLRSQGNFDGAATIDLTDLNDVLNNLGTALPANSAVAGRAELALGGATQGTPEPGSLGVLGVVGLVGLRRRVRRARG